MGAALFPEYFGLQIAATIVALGGRIGQGAAPKETMCGYDAVSLCLVGAILPGLLNLLWLGPLTSRFMVEMYNLCPEGFYGNSQPFSAPLMPNDEEKKKVKMRFGIVHGLSMLLNLASLVQSVSLWFYLLESSSQTGISLETSTESGVPSGTHVAF